ncbi:hypothetical protein WDZ92_39015, partial [Nostoc sp. NIES-2111]
MSEAQAVEAALPGMKDGCAPEEVRAALQRVLASETFVQSPQLQSFLSFVVSRTLEGHGEQIKGYTVATEALGRPADFDPVADPIVRVEARRLRKAPARYYDGPPGTTDPVRIVLPANGSVPTFEPAFVARPAPPRADPPPPPPPPPPGP